MLPVPRRLQYWTPKCRVFKCYFDLNSHTNNYVRLKYHPCLVFKQFQSLAYSVYYPNKNMLLINVASKSFSHSVLNFT